MKFNFDRFIGIIAFTIIAIRVYLGFHPAHSPVVEGFPMHHYMYGLVFILAYFATKNYEVLALGLALFIDELYLVIKYRLHDWPRYQWPAYESWQSALTITISLITIVLIRFFYLQYRDDFNRRISKSRNKDRQDSLRREA